MEGEERKRKRVERGRDGEGEGWKEGGRERRCGVHIGLTCLDWRNPIVANPSNHH